MAVQFSTTAIQSSTGAIQFSTVPDHLRWTTRRVLWTLLTCTARQLLQMSAKRYHRLWWGVTPCRCGLGGVPHKSRCSLLYAWGTVLISHGTPHVSPLTPQSSKGALTRVHVAKRRFSVSEALNNDSQHDDKTAPLLSQNGDLNPKHVEESINNKKKKAPDRTNITIMKKTNKRCPPKLDFDAPSCTESLFHSSRFVQTVTKLVAKHFRNWLLRMPTGANR